MRDYVLLFSISAEVERTELAEYWE